MNQNVTVYRDNVAAALVLFLTDHAVDAYSASSDGLKLKANDMMIYNVVNIAWRKYSPFRFGAALPTRKSYKIQIEMAVGRIVRLLFRNVKEVDHTSKYDLIK